MPLLVAALPMAKKGGGNSGENGNGGQPPAEEETSLEIQVVRGGIPVAGGPSVGDGGAEEPSTVLRPRRWRICCWPREVE